jgi:hypothetical protein
VPPASPGEKLLGAKEVAHWLGISRQGQHWHIDVPYINISETFSLREYMERPKPLLLVRLI